MVAETTLWPAKASIRRASVNSFGYSSLRLVGKARLLTMSNRYGGSNAHCILEAADSVLPGYTVGRARGHPEYPNGYYSGHKNCHTNETDLGLEGRQKFLLAFSAHSEVTLDKQISNICNVTPNYDLVDLSYTLGVRRSRFFYRAFALGQHGHSFEIRKGNKPMQPLTPAFVFTGKLSNITSRGT